MKLLDRDIKLAIFDLDGTLIVSTGVWADVDKSFFSKRGMDVPKNYQKEIAHIGLKEAAKITKEKYCPNENIEDIIEEWKEMVIEEYRDKIGLKEGAKELLDKLISLGVHLALATANNKDLYEPCLKRLEIYDYFDFIIDVNSTKEGKNSSEIYDKVSEHFNLSRENVMVIEDLPQALNTAYNAGYLTIGIYDPSTSKSDKEMEKICHLYVKDHNKISYLIDNEN